MIRFQLRCERDHRFEAWFRSNADYDGQSAAAQIECPACGSHAVEKALMAPAVPASTRRRDDVPVPTPARAPAAAPVEPPLAAAAGLDPDTAKAMALMREMTRRVRAASDYVGPRFAEEARKIHFEEAPPRSIYGEATAEEARELAEDGIAFHPLPVLPEDRN